MTAERERPPWLVRVHRASGGGPPDGAGLLCGPRHILTCAHVVSPAGRMPEGPVWIRFQNVDHDELLPATVVPEGWHPVSRGGSPHSTATADVAVLELAADPPPGAGPAPLVRTSAGVWHHHFHSYGFPAKSGGGRPVSGTVVGPIGAQWLHLEATEGWTPEPGFSGAPVWDDQNDGVIGMLTAREKPGSAAANRATYAIRTEALAGYWPPLKPLVREPPPDERQAALQSRLALPLTADGNLPPVRDVDPYQIGVSPSAYSQPRPDGRRPDAYVPRRATDEELDAALDAAADAASDSPLVLLTGPSKAGKSRTLFELLLRRMPDARLLVPAADRSAPGDLSRLQLPPGPEPVVLWLDELEHYVGPGGLDLPALRRFTQGRPRVVVVASITSLQYRQLHARPDEQGRMARGLLRLARRVELPQQLDAEDLADADRHYPRESFTTRGIGQVLVAAPELEQRLASGFEECPAGWAVTRAAADRRRMGLGGAVPEAELFRIFAAYVRHFHPSLDADETAFRAGLAWARDPVVAQVALLYAEQPAGDDGERAYAVFPYIPDYLDGRSRDPDAAVPAFAWRLTVGDDTPRSASAPGADLLTVAITAMARDEQDAAIRALRRLLDGAGTPYDRAWAAVLLGELHLGRNEFAEGIGCLERALEYGVPEVEPLAQVELAGALMVGDRERAGELLASAMECGDRQVALLAKQGYASLLVLRGEHERALAVLEEVLNAGDDEVVALARWRIGDMLAGEGGGGVLRGSQPLQGTAPGSGNPGRTGLLRPRDSGDTLAGNSQWALPRRVDASMATPVTQLAKTTYSAVLVNQGKLEDAEAMLRQVIAEGHPLAAPLAGASLGDLLWQLDREDEARRLLEEAVAGGHPLVAPLARTTLGALLLDVPGEAERGAGLLRGVAGSGHPDQAPRAAFVLGTWHANSGEPERAGHRLRAATGSGHPDWGPAAELVLAGLALQNDEVERGERMLGDLGRAGHREIGPAAYDLLGDLLAELERYDEAETAYRQAIATGHDNWATVARIDLALMLAGHTDPGESEGVGTVLVLLGDAERSGHPEMSPRAALLQGQLLAELGRRAEAESAFRRAVGTGHENWAHEARIDLALLLAGASNPARPWTLDTSARLLQEATAAPDEAQAAWATTLLGRVRLAQGEQAEGLGLLREAAGRNQGTVSAAARYFVAKELLDNGTADGRKEAEALLERLVRDESPESASVTDVARATLGVLRLRQGEHEAANELLTAAEESGNTEAMAEVYTGRGEYLLDIGEADDAAELLEAALALEDADTAPRATLFLGMAYLALQRREDARTRLTQALELGGPGVESPARRYLGTVLAQLERPAEAEEVLLPLASAEGDPERPRALLMLARLAHDNDRPGVAAERFEMAITCGDPATEAEALEDYRRFLRETGRWDRLAEIQSPTAAAPALPEPVRPSALPALTLALLGTVAGAQRQEREARYWYRRALAAPDADGAHELARARLEEGGEEARAD
ncbi:hypothetical protein SRB5_51170 [Streptomyces sp. RB5]|uniref:Ancillary SecYEG translocon subunit/Cell division coordinator CpoB TPR domain-containing protein n=1 Tax=Streptomyces smaragdinus TaxID=2585196 RepID=A0A7K0CNF1_9ACTN|nr:tetratricopeptide repeat protein [Streptomyces smaragdinus]MQY14941.1 hypothetical protein [Streptomyces smaragdinus]